MKNPSKKSKKAPSKAQEHMESFNQNYGWALVCHPYFNNNPDVPQSPKYLIIGRKVQRDIAGISG